MSNFFDFLNNLSLKTIMAINIILAILIFIPLTIILLREQTKLAGKANVPVSIFNIGKLTPTETPSLLPPEPAVITSVLPFYGKVGDSVIISGKNFGSQKTDVFFNNVPALEIKFWKRNKIHVIIPPMATSGPIKLKEATSPYNFIIFDKNTNCEVFLETKDNTKIFGDRNCPPLSKIKVVLKIDDSQPIFGIKPLAPLTYEMLKVEKDVINEESVFKIDITLAKEVFLEKLISLETLRAAQLTLVSVELLDGDNLVPFFVNPLSLTN